MATEIQDVIDNIVTRWTKPEDLPEMLTPEEGRIWIGAGRSLMFDLLRRQEIRSIRVGRLIRIPRAALVAFANGTEED
jgi:excisionase family DNA binding protein